MDEPEAPELDPQAPEETGPMRTCAVTRARFAPEEMIRFVLSPDGEVTPDIRRRLPGRGLWIAARADSVRLALKRQVFSRQLRRRPRGDAKPSGPPIAAPADLAERVDALLARDALQSLSIANKAGAVVAGFAKAEAALAEERPTALLSASEGGADGQRKLRAALRRRWGEAAVLTQDINIFASEQLDLALGRTNVIHAVTLPKAAGAAFVSRALKLIAYRTDVADLPARGTAGGAHGKSSGADPAGNGQDVILTGPEPEGRKTDE